MEAPEAFIPERQGAGAALSRHDLSVDGHTAVKGDAVVVTLEQCELRRDLHETWIAGWEAHVGACRVDTESHYSIVVHCLHVEEVYVRAAQCCPRNLMREAICSTRY